MTMANPANNHVAVLPDALKARLQTAPGHALGSRSAVTPNRLAGEADARCCIAGARASARFAGPKQATHNPSRPLSATLSKNV
jgi:hypothetical protein